MNYTKGGPKVSVIIPTYNRSPIVGRAIRSVLNQTYKNLELIIVNDASEDETEKVVKNIKDERIIYLSHEKNKGGGAARNTGLKVASGKYVALLDDDDEWLLEKVEKQIKKFQTLSNANVGLIYSGFYYVSGKNGKFIMEIQPVLRGKVYISLLEACILGSPTPLIEKTCFQKAGFYDEKLPSCQDWDMWIRISKYYEFDFVPDVLAKTYIHGKQISVNLDAKIWARERILQKHFEELQRCPNILAAHLEKLGILYCLANNSDKGKMYFGKAIKADPKRKKSYIHFFLSSLVTNIHKKLLTNLSVTNFEGIRLYY